MVQTGIEARSLALFDTQSLGPHIWVRDESGDKTDWGAAVKQAAEGGRTRGWSFQAPGIKAKTMARSLR